jgi:hypothetical protein
VKELYRWLEELTERWQELERLTANMELCEDSAEITVRRLGGKMRLCYKDKPISELSMKDKIEAAHKVGGFLSARKDRIGLMICAAKCAYETLAQEIEGLKKEDRDGEFG